MRAAQFDLARQYGFSSWRALKAHIDSLTIDGQLADAARKGEVDTLKRLLEKHPDRLHLRIPPYEWTLLHEAANNGQLAAVDLLLKRGLVRTLLAAGADPNIRDTEHKGDVIGWAEHVSNPQAPTGGRSSRSSGDTKRRGEAQRTTGTFLRIRRLRIMPSPNEDRAEFR